MMEQQTQQQYDKRIEESVHRIGSLAMQAMLFEVAATPKPGLVDRNNSGAHRDMDYFTFMASAAAIGGTMEKMARAGFLFAENADDGEGKSLEKLLPELKKIGLEGEKKMFAATGGVNTHKGMIFSLGLLCGSAGYLEGMRLRKAETAGTSAAADTAGTAEADEAVNTDDAAAAGENVCGPMTADIVCGTAARIIAGVCRRELAATAKQPGKVVEPDKGGQPGRGEEPGKEGQPGGNVQPSKGEQVYLRHGITGARGEAESGFATVRRWSLPVYRELRKEGREINTSLVQALLYLIAHNTDTNIVARHDPETLVFAQERSQQALALGGMLTEEGREDVRRMDAEFIDRWISPGGSADLVALTHFLYEIEKG